MRVRWISTVALAATVLSGAPAVAGPLAPKRPSDVVALRSSGASCSLDPSTRRFDQRVLKNGTLEPFTIPAGRVLVITGVDWVVQDTGPIGTTQLLLYVETSAPLPVPIFSDGGTSGDGLLLKTSLVPQAIVDGSGPLCAATSIGVDSIAGVVHGFLAKDR